MKKESPTKVVEAIRRIIKGEIYVSPSVADQVLHQIVNGRTTPLQLHQSIV